MRCLGLILVACGLAGSACEQAVLESADAGQAVELRMEDVRLLASIRGTPQFAFEAARVWFDEEQGRLRAEDVRGRLEPSRFAEAKP